MTTTNNNNVKTNNVPTTNNVAKNFEKVSDAMKATKDTRNEWKKEFCSLSKLLRDMQTTKGFEIIRPIFVKYNIPLTRKVKAAELESTFKFWYTDKKGNSFPCFYGKQAQKVKTKTIIDGKETEIEIVKKDAEGKVIYDDKLIPVKVWTLDNLVKVLSTNK